MTLCFGQDPVFRSETRLVEVPVVVLDRKTHLPVRGLTAADFVLKENHKQQNIVAFSFIDGRKKLGQEGLTEDERQGRYTNRRDVIEEQPPSVAIVIDALNSKYVERRYAALAAANVIESTPEPVLWGVYVITKGGVRVLHDYSADRASLIRQLTRMKSQGDESEILDDATVKTQEVELPARSQSGLNIMTADHEWNLRASMDGLKNIAAHMGVLPGRKGLVWMTAGFSLTEARHELPTVWHSMLEGINQADVAIYAIDVRGNTGEETTFLAQRRTGPNLPDAAKPPATLNTDVMQEIASLTGGKAYFSSNDLERGVKQATADAGVVYRLAYRPEHGKWDGRYLSIQVEVKGAKYEVRHRDGYLAEPLSAPKTPDLAKLVRAAILSPVDASELGLTVQLEPSPQDKTRVIIQMEAGGITLRPNGEKWGGQFDLRFVQRSSEGNIVDDQENAVVWKMSETMAKKISAEGAHYERVLNVRPETRSLKVVLVDRATGRIGSVTARLGSR